VRILHAKPQNSAIRMAAIRTTAPRLIAIDMDGTLLGEDGRVSPRNLAALRAAEAAGIEIVIATGRRHSYALRVLRPLGLHHATALVSSNGAVTRTLGAFPLESEHVATQLIARANLPHATALWLCSHLHGSGDQNFRNALVLTFDRVGPDGDDTRGALVVEHLEELHSSIGRWMAANEPYIAHINPIESALTPESDPPIQAMLCGTRDRMSRAEAHLRALLVASHHTLNLNRTEYPARDLSILDILPAGASKGAAILSLAATRQIDSSEILAIGDNWNDVSMLEVAGQSVLMDNAPEDLKSLAVERNWTIGPSNHHDGVAEAIESALAVAEMVG